METSADGQNWHRDARYFYYPHGPLERVELGEHLVQGMDYAYTLQGWLKGINGDRLNPNTDMGRDGDPSVTTNPNLLAGRDAYALSLGYYGDADYKGIASTWDDNTPANIVQRPIAPIGASGTANTVAETHKPLYNGNIAHTVNTLQHFGLWDAGNGAQGQVLAQVYHYDQLNRLKKARGFIGMTSANTWSGVVDAAENRYRSEYEYDANGNIVSAERFDLDQNHYDSFSYKYEKRDDRVARNRLYQLDDVADQPNNWVNETAGAQDIAWTGAVTFNEEDLDINDNYNYGYDALGNLVRDDRANILTIDWTVAGKVKEVDHAIGMGPDLRFAYGADGQRIAKTVGYPEAEVPTGYREHYIRDAQGNIMATYRFELLPVPESEEPSYLASMKLTERPVYGSSRLGTLRKVDEELRSLPSFDPFSANPIQQVDLNYELTDHLGNVCAVVTGRLLDGNGGGTPKQADLLSAQGYEPFGSLLPGRNFSSESYNYGFQGQLKDDEINGAVGTSYAFEYRIHDSRVGKFLSLDPLANQYPHNSPYAFSENRLIDSNELEGLETIPGGQIVSSDDLLALPIITTATESTLTPNTQWDSNLTLPHSAPTNMPSDLRTHGENLEKAGDVVQVGSLPLVLGQPEIGVPALVLGDVLSKIGVGFQVVSDLQEGKTADAVFKVGMEIAFDALGSVAKNKVAGQVIETHEKAVAGTGTELVVESVKKVTEAVVDDSCTEEKCP